jgi:hypothetical protein
LYVEDSDLFLGSGSAGPGPPIRIRQNEYGSGSATLGWELTVLVFLQRVTLKNHSTGEEKILFLSSEQEKDKTHFTDQVGSILFVVPHRECTA